MLKGIAAAPGISIAKAFLLDSEEFVIQQRHIPEPELAEEIARFEEALIKTRSEILNIQKKITEEMEVEHAEIFNAHLLVLEDRMLIEEVIEHLKKEKVSVEYIFMEVLKKYMDIFSKIDDEYLRERIIDIGDVGKRVLKNLLGKQLETIKTQEEPVIVVAYNLSPSDTVTLHRKNITGFITDVGGRTSHTAIIARSLRIPAVVGLENATKKIKNSDLLILDGTEGTVIINPDKQTLKKYIEQQKKQEEFRKRLLKLKNLPCETLDGHRIELSANIEFPEEIPAVLQHGSEGIGLYRTEYFYMNRTDLPDEEEHFKSYKYVAQKMSPNPVIIRTLDLGGDKFVSQLNIPREMNPFLGWRAIRFCLARPEVFKVQLRAILRASHFGKLKIMYPMISGIEELKKANTILKEVKQELERKKIDFDEDIEVGAMIEIPSAALTCDILAKEVDFFSIGTNDLIQYSLAVDRANEKIAYLYEPAHPAVLRLIKNIIEVAHDNGIWAGMCGEMAGEPHFALLLLGLGLDEFSVSPIVVPAIKNVIRSVKLEDVREFVREALKLTSGKQIEEFTKKFLKEVVSY
ncbi:MAG: phosphoenolpyruvate--protein phosphotransferase [Candidatus Omnitrophica bacterium]|nr:phosphoenolpyruvate--protein phosphotransferase [Candidatus Omnitrophota bacterium]